mgnify:CR=1 FL=1
MLTAAGAGSRNFSLGIALGQVQPSLPTGRLLKEDLYQHVKRQMDAAQTARPPAAGPAEPPVSGLPPLPDRWLVLRVLLPALPALNAARQQVAAQYSAVLGALPGGALPPRPTEAVDVAHLFVLRHARRDTLRAALLARGIQTDIHYPLPDHLQPGFIARLAALGEPPMAPAGALPVSEAACAEVFSLPCHPSLDAGQVQRVCDALREVW